MQNFKQIKKIFFVGIGGIGVSALVKLFKSQDKKVTGSDKYSSEITNDLKKQGIKVYIGHNEKNLDSDTDLIIYSPAVKPEVPEREKAFKLGIKQLSYPEALGLISKNRYTIAVSGTHGKSTTTAMLGLILAKARFDPTVIVGSKVGLFKNGNLRIGKSRYFIVEACEWQAHMLNLRPKIIILTNIEPDHLDYYKTFKNLKQTFKKYVRKLPKDGLLIVNADDKVCLEVVKSAKCKTVSYSIKSNFDFSLQVPGRFNIYNALAASTCALELGIKPEIIKKTLVNFKGIWRRFEKVGEYKGALIFSDYAHHPTAIKETLRAAKESYLERRLVVVYQPHHFDRTKRLFKKFTKAFDLANLVILNEIYDVPGREVKRGISSKDLVRELKKRKVKAIFTKDLEETKKILLKNIKRGDLVLIMGAGDIYDLSTALFVK
jgi:UDP-N-acetylmuramate--alanine ligase